MRVSAPFKDWDKEGGLFEFLSTSFDLYEAKNILRSRPRPSTKIKVRDWIHFLPFKEERGLRFTVEVDWKKAQSEEVDLTVPVIVARISRDCALVIDGWHRIAKGHCTSGCLTLPAVVLTVPETRKVRV